MLSTLTYSQENLSYGHVEKYKQDSIVHYLQVKLIDNILQLEKAVMLQDSTGSLITKIMTKESYRISAPEMNEIQSKLFELCHASEINLKKVEKERLLLSDNIEDQVKLDSKASLIILDGEAYFIKNKVQFEMDNMTEAERDEFFRREKIIKLISTPVQEIYRKKSREYKDLFY